VGGLVVFGECLFSTECCSSDVILERLAFLNSDNECSLFSPVFTQLHKKNQNSGYPTTAFSGPAAMWHSQGFKALMIILSGKETFDLEKFSPCTTALSLYSILWERSGSIGSTHVKTARGSQILVLID